MTATLCHLLSTIFFCTPSLQHCCWEKKGAMFASGSLSLWVQSLICAAICLKESIIHGAKSWPQSKEAAGQQLRNLSPTCNTSRQDILKNNTSIVFPYRKLCEKFSELISVELCIFRKPLWGIFPPLWGLYWLLCKPRLNALDHLLTHLVEIWGGGTIICIKSKSQIQESLQHAISHFHLQT